MTNGDKLPKRVRKAIRIISGYCDKNETYKNCMLRDFCPDERSGTPANWIEWLEREVTHNGEV